MLFDAGVDVKSAQKFLGHADIEVTLSIYTHLTKFKEDIAITALDEHIQKKHKMKTVVLNYQHALQIASPILTDEKPQELL